jgi:methylenetetrahydrofolate reductase (NADPH)
METALPPLDQFRYEILPFGSFATEAAALAAPLTLTVTCSPKQGVDHTVEAASKLRELGHTVIVHLAARMIRSPLHLNELLARMASLGIADVFLVGGDASSPAGPYTSALDLLPELRASANAPRTIGVAAYPEGHPVIGERALADALHAKSRVADYMTTQMCFDSEALLRWLERTRDAGVELPLYVGLPGLADRRRLLEISMRVGVGASLSFVRKQQGLRRLVGRRTDVTRDLFSTYATLLGGSLGIEGVHFFTFNSLIDTHAFVTRRADEHTAEPLGEAKSLPSSIR